MALNALIEDLRENAASVTMSAGAYATIPHSVPFLTTAAPGKLTFMAGATAATLEDTKLLYAKQVYSFELESTVTKALKNIIAIVGCK